MYRGQLQSTLVYESLHWTLGLVGKSEGSHLQCTGFCTLADTTLWGRLQFTDELVSTGLPTYLTLMLIPNVQAAGTSSTVSRTIRVSAHTWPAATCTCSSKQIKWIRDKFLCVDNQLKAALLFSHVVNVIGHLYLYLANTFTLAVNGQVTPRNLDTCNVDGTSAEAHRFQR